MELSDALDHVPFPDNAYTELAIEQVEALARELAREEPRTVELTGIAYCLEHATKAPPEVVTVVAKRIAKFVEHLLD